MKVDIHTLMTFNKLAREWRNNANAKIYDHSYLRIVGMGPQAIPLILREFKKNPHELWSYALYWIVGVSFDRPTYEEVRMAWLDWGDRMGYINHSSYMEGVKKEIDAGIKEADLYTANQNEKNSNDVIRNVLNLAEERINDYQRTIAARKEMERKEFTR